MTSSEQSLELELDRLRKINTSDTAERVLGNLQRTKRAQRRQVVFASLGFCTSLVAAVYFTAQDDPIGYFALAATTLVFAFVAWVSSRRAASIASLESGTSLLATWRGELEKKRRNNWLAVSQAGLFALLTAWVINRHGFNDVRAILFLTTTTGIVVYAAYRVLIVRPAVLRELDVLNGSN